MPIRALIVDDEPMARTVIRDFLAEAGDIEVVGEAGDGAAAVRLIETTQADLVFLDVQMPEFDRLDVVEAVGASRMPFVIFLTAYDKYALRAFEVHALDYLLKPFSRARFEEALDHARRYVAMAKMDMEFKSKIKSLLQDIQEANPCARRFFIQSRGKVRFLKAEEVEWAEATGNYVLLHVG
jgi:two-component system LytT family response regulator